MLIPVICDNEECRTVWFAPNLISGNGNAVMSGSKMSPCPACNGSGTIPDGEYTRVGGTIFDASQWAQVSAAFSNIRSAILRGDSVEQVREVIESHSVLAAYLKQFIPQDLKDLRNLLIIIGMIYAACRFMASSSPPEQLLVPKPAAEIVSQILGGDPDANGEVTPEDPPEHER